MSFGRIFWVIFSSFSLLCPIVASGSQPLPSFPMVIRYERASNLLSVKAENVPLSLLISEIATRSGIKISWPIPSEKKVSIQCKRSPLDQVLRLILKQSQLNYGLVYGKDGLRRIVFLESGPMGQSGGHEASPDPEEGPRPGPGPGGSMPGMPSQAAPDAVMEKLLAQSNHQDPGIRVVALEQLSQYQGDERARRRLMEGLKDPDPDVRSAASGLLGQTPPEEAPEEVAPDDDNQ